MSIYNIWQTTTWSFITAECVPSLLANNAIYKPDTPESCIIIDNVSGGSPTNLLRYILLQFQLGARILLPTNTIESACMFVLSVVLAIRIQYTIRRTAQTMRQRRINRRVSIIIYAQVSEHCFASKSRSIHIYV